MNAATPPGLEPGGDPTDEGAPSVDATSDGGWWRRMDTRSQSAVVVVAVLVTLLLPVAVMSRNVPPGEFDSVTTCQQAYAAVARLTGEMEPRWSERMRALESRGKRLGCWS